MARKRGEDGTFVEDATHAEVLAVFDAVAGPVVTSADVATALDCSSETARRKLNELVEDGRLGRRESGHRIYYWKRPIADPDPVDPHDPIFTDRPSFASGRENLSQRVNELLYEKAE